MTKMAIMKKMEDRFSTEKVNQNTMKTEIRIMNYLENDPSMVKMFFM